MIKNILKYGGIGLIIIVLNIGINKHDIKSLEKQCESVLQDETIYSNSDFLDINKNAYMDSSSVSTARLVIDNWDKFEPSFKTSYQSKKDYIEKYFKLQDDRIELERELERERYSKLSEEEKEEFEKNNEINLNDVKAEYNYTHRDTWH